MERSDGEGGGVMSNPNAKAEDKENSERPKKPPGYRKFAKLLKQVVKAPPFKKRQSSV
jgi:hypothetical protein